MPCLLDTNVVIRLNKYNLCKQAIEALNTSRDDLHLLREMDHHLDNNSSYGKPIFTAKQLRRCQKFCDGLKRITDPYAHDRSEFLRLTKKHDIRHDGYGLTLDPGEAQLFAYTGSLKKFSIWTADNRSLIALSKWPDCEAIRSRIAGKVHCWARILRALIDEVGYERVAAVVIDDTGATGKAIAAGESRCCGMLKAAEDELQAACNGLLAN